MRMMAEEIRQAFEAAGWEAGKPIGEEEAERLEMAIRGEAGRYTRTAHRSVLVLDPCSSCVTGTGPAWRGCARSRRPADEADTADPATSPLPPTVPEREDR